MVIFGYNYGTLLEVFYSDLNIKNMNINPDFNIFNNTNNLLNPKIVENKFITPINEYKKIFLSLDDINKFEKSSFQLEQISNNINKFNKPLSQLKNISLSTSDFHAILEKFDFSKRPYDYNLFQSKKI